MKSNSQMLIDGKWVDSTSSETIYVLNPANEEIVGSVPKGEAEEAKKALGAAQRAFKGWAALPVSKRSDFLHKAADLTRQKQEEISRLLTLEQALELAPSVLAHAWLRRPLCSCGPVSGHICSRSHLDSFTSIGTFNIILKTPNMHTFMSTR